MILKDKDINDLYTNLLKIYLIDGYDFYYQEMRGSQSNELAKTLLKKDDEIICLSVESEVFNLAFKKIVYVKKFDYQKIKNENFWLYKGEVIFEKTFYEVNYRRDVYTDSLKELEEIEIKRLKRYKNKRENNVKKIYNFDKEKICKILNKRKGFKSVRKNQIDYILIEKTKSSKYYTVYIKNKREKLLKYVNRSEKNGIVNYEFFD